MKSKPTIKELEALLNSEEDRSIHILPDGSIKVGRKGKKQKVITMKENLGGEYGKRFNNTPPPSLHGLHKSICCASLAKL